MCSCVLCSLQHNTHNITPLLVHPLLPLKQQDCQCCNHYCHLLHLALLVSFEERSLYTFDAHPRGSGRSTDKNCGGHFRTEADGGWTVGVGENVQCGLPRGWQQSTLLHLARPWGGGGHEYGIGVCGQSLICWVQEECRSEAPPFSYFGSTSDQLVTSFVVGLDGVSRKPPSSGAHSESIGHESCGKFGCHFWHRLFG